MNAMLRVIGMAALFNTVLIHGAMSGVDPTGTLTHNRLAVKGLTRTFLLYVPRALKPHPSLLFFFHGSGGDGQSSRAVTGFEFDQLADRDGFLAVYPDGVENTWNDCRKGSPQPARVMNIDDESFVDVMIAKEIADHGADARRVFAAGWSNGGQFAYRLAMERPKEFAAVAAISAGLPTAENMACRPSGAPMAVMIVDGTGDPINPFSGGMVMIGGSSLGTVLSAEATGKYFARLNGISETPVTVRLPHKVPADPTSVERYSWIAPGKPGVVLYTVQGGGHVVPQRSYEFPDGLGRQTKDLDAPIAIWDFFASQPPRP